jgi:cobyrinic acid a,c-diamide synthase
MTACGFILAAPASGTGKTVAAALLLAAFRQRGLAVASFKTGPDYIDPGFLAAGAGRDVPNIDPWGMRPETQQAILSEISASASLVIGEGVMGLFDGARDGTGSTADLAAALRLPVVLVIDGRGMAASAAALIQGFAHHREDINVAGVVFTRIGHSGHYDMLADAAKVVGVAPLGWIGRDLALELPSRHLGLVQAGEHGGLGEALSIAAGKLSETVNLDGLLELAAPVATQGADAPPPIPPLGQRIAVAYDEAFRFAYPHVLDGWRDAGAEVAPFSPLEDEAPDGDADAIYLPGGYPELHAGRIAAAGTFLRDLRRAADQVLIYGECGGYMVLGEGLTDAEGAGHEMAGLLPIETSMQDARPRLGYRRVWLAQAAPIQGSAFRGHEHHHAQEVQRPSNLPHFANAEDATGKPLGAFGAVKGRVAGSFLHLIDHHGYSKARAGRPGP